MGRWKAEAVAAMAAATEKDFENMMIVMEKKRMSAPEPICAGAGDDDGRTGGDERHWDHEYIELRSKMLNEDGMDRCPCWRTTMSRRRHASESAGSHVVAEDGMPGNGAEDRMRTVVALLRMNGRA